MANSKKIPAEDSDLFRAFYENSADAILLLENGVFTDCNQATVQMMRADNKDQFLALHPSVLSPEFQLDGRPSGEKADEMIRIALEKGSNRFEWTHRRVNGEDFPVEVLLTPIHIGDRTIIQTVWRDISKQMHSQEALRAERDFNQTLVEASPAFLVTINGDASIRSMNQAMLDATGYSLEEVQGKDYLSTVVSEDERPMLAGIFARLTELREPTLNQNYVLARDGRHILVEWRGRPVLKPNGEFDYFFGLGLDITEQKQAQAELLRLKNAVEQTGDGIAITDMEGNMLYANPAWAEMHGYTPEEIKGKHLSIFHTQEQVERDVIPFNEMVMATGRNTGEVGHVRKDGTTFPTFMTTTVLKDEKGNSIGLVGTARDITAQIQTREALQENERLFRTVVDFTYDWEYWLDPEGKFQYVSPSCERVSGYRPEEFENNADLFREIVHPEDVETWEEHIRTYHSAHSAGVGEANLRIITREGKTRWLGHVCQAVHDNAGNWQGRRASNRDITARIQLEQEIQESLERRGRQVEVSTQVSQYIAAATDVNDLYQRVVTQVREQFGYYHTQILRYDPAQNAVALVSGYGDVGAKMLAAGHQLPMGTGLIGTAAATGETVLRPSLADDPDWQPNPLLPYTKGEIAVPIKLGEDILGVLDVQSNLAGALNTDDQLVLEGLCGQIAIAIENTRLRQETAERIEEVNRLYRAVSREGWQAYRESENLPTGFMFDQTGVVPFYETGLTKETFINQPITVPGGEVIGTLSIPEDPQNPLSSEDQGLLQQISEQIALALESARLFDQTQSALAQTERLSDASLRFARAADLQELLVVVNETLGIPVVNRVLMGVFNYGSNNELESMDIVANWWSGSGHQPSEIGRHYTMASLNVLPLLMSSTTVFFNDTFHDERINAATLETFARQNIHSMAALPLYLGARQVGVLFLESEEPHNFTQDEIRLFSAMAPQIATVLENRRQFERAQQQADRETTLNLISQKIQSATTVEAVLQIAARELGHALGAPMTIAQLSMKDRK
jgi:PAS domain S-box-containing protein